MHILDIDRFSVTDRPRGTLERLSLRALDLLAGPVTLPAIVATGSEPGPALFLVAGVHGNEYEGMEAIRAIFSELQPLQMTGSVAAILVANPWAYEGRERITPAHLDGLNLARVFPGKLDGSPTQVLAARLLDLIQRNVGPDDLFMDFHSGSHDVAFATMIGFRDLPGKVAEGAQEAARHTGCPALWRIPDGPGPFNAETSRRGIPTLGTETTGRAGCKPEDVAAYTRMLRGLLAYLDICSGWPKLDRIGSAARLTLDLESPATGFLRTMAHLHQSVVAGQCLGKIVDVYGDERSTLVAPADGEIWAVRETPAVRSGELCFMIALGPPESPSR